MGVSGIVWYAPSACLKIEEVKLIGHSSASDLVTKDTVAVKKLNDPFRTDLSTKIFLREIRLLQQLRHENVRILAVNKYKILMSAGHQSNRHVYFPF